MATFITSKTSGSIYVSVNTTTGYWKSYHNGSYNGTSNTPQIYSDSGTFEQRSARLDITGSTGEFTIVSCDVNGNVSGDVTLLNLSGCDIISFDGTGLTGLTKLNIQENQLTSFDATGMTSLIWLYLCTQLNQPPTTALLTNVNVSGLVNLRKLVLSNNKLTWGGLSGLSTLSSLTWLNLDGNSLTQFDGTGLSSLLQLDLFYNQVTTSGITNLPNTLTKLNLRYNRLTTFDATSLTNLTNLTLNSNQLSSVNLSGLTQLNFLELSHNQLPSINVSGLTSLAHLNLSLNRLTTIDVSGLTNLVDLLIHYNPSITSSVNNQILQQLDQNGAVGDTSANKYFPSNGYFSSSGGRTSAGNTSFNNLSSKNWDLDGVDLLTPPPTATFTTSKSVGETIKIEVYTTTGYWNYYHNGVSNGNTAWIADGSHTIIITSLNSQFTLFACNSMGDTEDEDGNVYGNIRDLEFEESGVGNKLTSVDVTGLSSLVSLGLSNNLLTTFDGTGLTNLVSLYLTKNLLTSFNSTGLTNLVELDLRQNQLTSFSGNGLGLLTELNLTNNPITTFTSSGMSNLTILVLTGNQLTSLNISGLTNLNELYIANLAFGPSNNITTSINNSILDVLNSNNVNGGTFRSLNGRTSIGTADYNSLISRGWTLTGVDLTYQPTTFKTSKSVGQKINVYANTSTGYWKYNHNGTDSGIFINGQQNNIKVTNVNGEFEIIPCDSNGIFSGVVTKLNLQNNRITQFDGTLGLTYLNLYGNRLTTFNGSGMSSLTSLNLHANRLTTFITTGLSQITSLDLYGNRLTQFDGTSLSSLTDLDLSSNRLTTFNGAGLSSLTKLNLYGNQLTTFIGGNMGLITSLNFQTWNITTLTTFSCAGLSSLTYLYMVYNTGISSIINNQILQDLNTNGLSNGTFMSNNGRTSLSNSNYTSLINKNWTFNATPNPTIYANGLNVFSWRSFDDDEIIGLPGDTWGDITTDEIPGLYSLQRISGTYSGPAIQIRRSYDNALMDIGFTTDGSLDLTTIYSFVGTASGYLTTFYDQTAAPDNNLTQPQTSTQPIIVSNGVPVSFQMPGADTSGATSSQPAQFNWWRKKGKIIKNLSKPVTMNITEPTEPFLIHFIDSNGNEVKNFSKPVSAEYNSY